jgi:hypothetical protein
MVRTAVAIPADGSLITAEKPSLAGKKHTLTVRYPDSH